MPGSETPRTAEQARLSLTADKDELAHLVCCRDEVWRVALCGYESDTINPAAEHFCTMCVEEALRRVPDLFERPVPTCFKDLRPCPDEHEVDLRILREVSP